MTFWNLCKLLIFISQLWRMLGGVDYKQIVTFYYKSPSKFQLKVASLTLRRAIKIFLFHLLVPISTSAWRWCTLFVSPGCPLWPVAIGGKKRSKSGCFLASRQETVMTLVSFELNDFIFSYCISVFILLISSGQSFWGF